MKAPALIVLSLTVIGCGEQPSRVESTPAVKRAAAEIKEYCGGELRAGATRDYADRLLDFLASGHSKAPDVLYDDDFYLLDTSGQITRRGVGPNPNPDAELTRQEWVEISQRLAAGVKGAGWRGCFLGDGKASFESSQPYDAELVLRSFDRARPWRD